MGDPFLAGMEHGHSFFDIRLTSYLNLVLSIHLIIPVVAFFMNTDARSDL